MKKQIHIHAQCPAFEIFEIVPESKAVSRLRDIRNGFEGIKKSRGKKFEGKLFVKTVVINPELPFVNLY